MSKGSGGSKTISGLFALSTTLVACLAGIFLLVQSFFPWMTVLNQKDEAPERASSTGAQIVDVTNGGPTPAEQILDKVLSTKVKALGAQGWSEIRATGGVPGVSFGFGCDPADGLAPVVAESRSWVQSRTPTTKAVGTLDVSARAYPAGGGAVAFVGLTDAVLRCDAASLYASAGLGIEVVQVVTATSSSLVWRRGDVILVGTVTSSGRPGDVSAANPIFSKFDKALKAALVGTCVNPVAGVDGARRSPYVNREKFYGNSEQVPVKRVSNPRVKTAEQIVPTKVVKIPAPHVELPYVDYLPVAPSNPPVVNGPTALPAPVSFPTEPVAPTARPVNRTEVSRKIDDPQGPGCGWAFTGQIPPNFAAVEASAEFDAAVLKAKRSMARSWQEWQDAKVSYYKKYAKYVRAAAAYKEYAAEVEEARQAWAIVEEARAVYYDAVAVYEAAVGALAQWRLDRAAAREEYLAAREECRTRPPEPDPEPEPTPAPGEPTPTAEPTPTEPEMVCPPVRPAILSEEPPVVPPVPVPAPEAQLPQPQAD